MKVQTPIRTLSAVAASMLLAVLLSSCESQGPDVNDPVSYNQQAALMAIDGTNGAELLQYREATGIKNPALYRAANKEYLGLPVDGMDESNIRVYLYHRADGSITVIDESTYKKLGRITGFPVGTDSTGLCSTAFSNLSQGWAVCYGTPKLYLLDAVNFVIARQIDLPGNPTSVAAAGTKVLVGYTNSNGTGGASMLSSNSGNYAIEKSVDLPSAPVAVYAEPGAKFFYILTVQSELYSFDPQTQTLSGPQQLITGSLSSHLGHPNNFSGLTVNGSLFVSAEDGVYRMTASSPSDAQKLLDGKFDLIGADYLTDILYGVQNSAPTQVQRVLFTGELLPSVTMPSGVRFIRFLNPSKAGQ